MRTPTSRRLSFRAVTARALFVLLALSAAGSIWAASDPIDPGALQQIQALLQEKEGRTPAQKKIDSNLLYTLKMSRNQPIATGISRLETGVDVDAWGTVVVDIVAPVNDGLIGHLEGVGARLIDYRFGYRNVRAEVSLESLETIAGWSDVIFIHPKQEAQTVGNAVALVPEALRAVSPSLLPKLRPGFEARAANVRNNLAAALKARSALRPALPNKINVSEGDVTHRANLARGTFGINGSGVKVGVLSDGVDSLASLQASGDLPTVTVLPGQAGSGDEGSAMLEIVYDLAPGAQLYFATAFTSITSFAQNIQDLRTAGCDIIVDDVFYFVETPFQTGQTGAVVSTTNGGIVTQAVNTVTAAGALYFSSAGNSGNKDDSTSGTWEGDFADAGAIGVPLPGTGNLLDFDMGAGVTGYNVVTAAGSGSSNLYWSDPLGGSANDYDLFVLNSAGSAVVSSSTNVQTGTQDPYEQVATPATNNRLVVVKRTGAANRFLHMSTNRGRLTFSTAGETHGHSATPVPFAFTVAATPAVSPGPYPGPFNSGDVVETFSSDGPRQVFFNADSTAITPGNFSSTGGSILQKPNVTAADGVSCAAPGFNPFYGTSAAAPHAAAIAALVKSAAPAATQTQILNYLTSTAIDIQAPGTDRDSGAGILDAYAAVQATGVNPHAFLVVGTKTLTEFSGNGNGYVEPGECGSLTVQLTISSTSVAATGISATLTTSTPGVTINIGTSTYPDILGSGSAVNATPFRFGLANTVACPLVVNFTLTVSYMGGATNPQVLTFTVRTGTPAVAISTTLDAVAPPNVTGVYTAVTGTQNNRLFRDGVVSACGPPKSFPGTSTTGTRLYDAYTFSNCAAGPVCVNVNLTQTSGPATALFSGAYSSSYDPNNVITNYLADAGVSGTNTTYSFNVAAGATFVVVVNEVTPGTANGSNYTLTVDGICLPCAIYTGTGCSTCPTITLSPGTLPTGTANTAYPPTMITPSGGTGPYTFNVSGLPAGMTPTGPVVGSSVTIGGTPTASFSGTVTVSGTDANGCPFSQNYSLIIQPLAAQPENFTAAKAISLPTDGTTKGGYVTGSGTAATSLAWFVATLRGGRSYIITGQEANANSTSTLSPFVQIDVFGSDAVSVPPGTVIGGNGGESDQSPGLRVFNGNLNTTVEGTWRVSYIPAAAANASEVIFIRVKPFYLSSGSEFVFYRVSVKETTLYCPWYYTDSNYEAYAQVTNTTSSNVAFTITFYSFVSVSGGSTSLVGSPVAFNLPPFGSTFVAAKGGVGVLAGNYGSAHITHNGAPGAIQANLTTVNQTGVGLTHSFNVAFAPNAATPAIQGSSNP